MDIDIKRSDAYWDGYYERQVSFSNIQDAMDYISGVINLHAEHIKSLNDRIKKIEKQMKDK